MGTNYAKNTEWVENYFFIEMPRTFTDYVTSQTRRSSSYRYSGKLQVRLITADPLFIGSGFQELENGKFVKQTMIENGRLLIPGSSLKGAVRQICRVISHSCVPKENRINLPPGTKKQCRDQEACIVCDMFGKMGWCSKVFFSDLTSESDHTEIIFAARQFSPHPDAKKYKDDEGYHSYKLYKTKIDTKSNPQDEKLRAVPPGTVFFGEISYRNLDERELELLLFALGQTKTISLKIGGYRNEGFGTVNLELTSEDIPDIEATAKKYAERIERVDEDTFLTENITYLEQGMPYKPWKAVQK